MSDDRTLSAADPSIDHADLSETTLARRYVQKFARITDNLLAVCAELERDRTLTSPEAEVIRAYISALARSFTALGHKFLLTGREGSVSLGALTIDRVDSGFPVFRELLMMANDAQQAARHLMSMPTLAELKEQMIAEIIGQQRLPTRLQFATSQRLYYEALAAGGLFWVTNDPVAIWAGEKTNGRRQWALHWAVYDSQLNLPTIYLLELEDSGGQPLTKDTRRWPEVQRHLSAQSVAGLKLLTIAQGFDKDFDDLHPKSLRRFTIGPMYSAQYTLQNGPLREVLDDAKASPDEDWALTLTLETLLSERVTREKTGWFGSAEREVFALDPVGGRGAETGATSTTRAVILPPRPYQVLAERNPPGFQTVRNFVVSQTGRVLSYR